MAIPTAINHLNKLSNFFKITGIELKKINMKKVTVTFEITKDTTTIITNSLSNKVDTIDITGTNIEKKFASLLKDLQKHQQTNEILQAIDINNWQEQSSK